MPTFPSRCRPRSLALVLCCMTVFIVAFEAQASRPEVAVAACGQVLSKQSGYLTGNLDCTGSIVDDVTLHDADLDLRGFTIANGFSNGIHCDGSCAVFSSSPGGTISGMELNGIDMGISEDNPGKLEVSDVSILNLGSGESAPSYHYGGVHGGWRGNTIALYRVRITGVNGAGVFTSGRQVKIEDSEISNNTYEGVWGHYAGSVKVQRSVFSGNGWEAVRAVKVTAKDSTFTGPGCSVSGDRIVVRGCTLTSCGVDVDYLGSGSVRDSHILGASSGVVVDHGKARIRDTELSGGYYGIRGEDSVLKVQGVTITGNKIGIYGYRTKIKILGSQLTGNSYTGVSSYGADSVFPPVVAQTSMITGNGSDPGCGTTYTCGDIVSSVRPEFLYVVGENECDISVRPHGAYDAPNWGVCALDCGNGALNGGEICDDGGESAVCDDNCTLPVCQDRNVNEAAGEQCDDGNVNYEDGCTPTCLREYCGDEIVQAGLGETCDAGGVDTAACDANCTSAVCGDGYRNKTAGEQCDDHNTLNGDGCSSTCRKE